ncbi:hypothetical protein Q604_UNBC10770G0001, partial [human gut metagenome]
YLNPPQEAPYMKNATFYLLDNDTTVDGLSAVEQVNMGRTVGINTRIDFF